MKSVTASTFFPSVCHEVMGPDAMTFVFLMLSFKPAFTLFFHSCQVFSSSLLSAFKVVSKVVGSSPSSFDSSL